jgi:hypothetical protein
MQKGIRLIFFLLVAVFAATGCAAAKRNEIVKRTTASTCEAAKMGRNKLYYTHRYKRHHGLETRKIRHKY